MNLNPFSKKKNPKPSDIPREPSPARIPTSDVQSLSARGMSEPDIINTLRNEGYTTDEIDHAMKSSLRSRVSGPSGGMPPRGPEPVERPVPPPSRPPKGVFDERLEPLPGPAGPPKEPFDPMGDLPAEPRGSDFGRTSPSFEPRPGPGRFEEPGFNRPRPPAMPQRPKRHKPMERKEMEELTEVIVDEKIKEFQGKFNSMNAHMQQMNKRIDGLKNEIEGIRSEKMTEVKEIEGMIEGFKTSIGDVTVRIDGMEKALKDSLSPMLESMRSLSETVKLLKQK